MQDTLSLSLSFRSLRTVRRETETFTGVLVDLPASVELDFRIRETADLAGDITVQDLQLNYTERKT